MGGQGLGLGQSQRNHALWSAVALGPRLSWLVARGLALVAELAASLPLDRPRFVSASAVGPTKTKLYEPAPLAGRATLGLEARF